MAYVTVGLSVMFGVAALLGFGAIDQATDLVFAERLATAHTTASILERDFERLAVRAREEVHEAAEPAGTVVTAASSTAGTVFRALSGSDVSPFFNVSGVWILDASAVVAESAGEPAVKPPSPLHRPELPSTFTGDGWAVVEALAPVEHAVAFAAVYVKLDPRSSDWGPAVVVNTVSVNSSAAYVPAAHGRTTTADIPTESASASEAYHLEVVDPDGIAVLGVGEDERPGEMSPHAMAIADLVREHRAAALLHEPTAGEAFEPHVMAVVPLASSPFYVALEQPIDVALALPEQLRQRLLLWVALGLTATLLVAWVTTRHVVKPTEELTVAATRIAGGDLASPITVSAGDEIGQLARTLDAMRARLREAQEAIERTNRELESRVAQRTAQLGEVLRQTISAQEDERSRLARELHDETAQTLAALSIALDRARESLLGQPLAARERIEEAKGISTRVLAETRRLILNLRPAILDDLGLVPAVRWQTEVALGEEGVEVSIRENLDGRRLPPHIEVALFRIVQEALTNVGRHSNARHVDVALEVHDAEIGVIVSDDGKGFDAERVLGSNGRGVSVGLIGMRERVALLGGRLSVESGPGRGTRIVVEVPLPGLPPAGVVRETPDRGVTP